MTQFLDYDDAGTVVVYHTVPSAEGTPGFEHRQPQPVAAIRNAKRLDGADDPDVLEVRCPVPGCGTVSWVPLLGDGEAQELHARVRHARGLAATLEAARVAVADAVRRRGGVPRVGAGRPAHHNGG